MYYYNYTLEVIYYSVSAPSIRSAFLLTLGSDDLTSHAGRKRCLLMLIDEFLLCAAGCLENELIQILVDYLIVGNEEIKLDMLKCLRGARDIQFINKVTIADSGRMRNISYIFKKVY